MQNVYDFYMGCDLLPLSAKVNLYDAMSKQKIKENYQDEKNDIFDNMTVKGYRWNPKTNLLMIWCS